MITFFTCPKPFSGHIDIIQRNAIQSWKRLHPDIEIILFGNEPGVREISEELNIVQISDIEKNDFGTPLLNDIFEKAQKQAKNDIVCYINSDIILLNDFIEPIIKVSKIKNKFLLIGQRWDVDIQNSLDFENDWENHIRSFVGKKGVLSSHDAIDYFVFRRGSIETIPPFAIGRPAWDNWFIYNALENKFSVIDGTKITIAIHQKHNYNHVKNRIGNSWNGPEADRNRLLAGGYSHMYTLKNTNYYLTDEMKIKPAFHNRISTIKKRCTDTIFLFITNSVKFMKQIKLW